MWGALPFRQSVPSDHLIAPNFTSGEFTTALNRKLGLPIPQLRTAVGMPLSNNTNSARKVGDACGHAYTTVQGASGDHVRTIHDTILAYVFDYFVNAGIPFKGGRGNSTKKHIRPLHSPEPLHDTILAYVFDDLDSAGIPFKGGRGKSTKKHIRPLHSPEPHICRWRAAHPGHPP